ncbi:MAG: GNAT family N-acetyltransferase [Candidatus Levyibacteriota bacterium]
MESHLDSIAWNALTGPQAKYATGAGGARRYAPGFSPIVGFENSERPDFDALRRCCEPGEPLYCADWSGAVPSGWRVDQEFTMFRMVWGGAMPADDQAPGASMLGPEHAAQAFDLATLTRPGPFGPRTIELGEYFGIFDGPRLVAMAGERMHAGRFREISGVCTHPDFQGRGYARRLMLKLLRRQMQRDETPFLHVIRGNDAAHRLYERMGFRTWRETPARVIARS